MAAARTRSGADFAVTPDRSAPATEEAEAAATTTTEAAATPGWKPRWLR